MSLATAWCVMGLPVSAVSSAAMSRSDDPPLWSMAIRCQRGFAALARSRLYSVIVLMPPDYHSRVGTVTR